MDELTELSSAVEETRMFARGPRIAESGARIRAMLADFLYVLCALAVFSLILIVLRSLLRQTPDSGGEGVGWRAVMLFSLRGVVGGGTPGNLNEGFVVE